MRRYGADHRLLAAALAFLAGYVDAIGFLRLGGLFVSFMSGNSTRLGIETAAASPAALVAARLVVGFVLGAAAGAIVARRSGRWRQPAVLAAVTLGLLVAASVARLWPEAALPTMVMAAAMGAMNNVFQHDGEVSVGVTYMTGTLVKVGQHLAALLDGESPAAFVSYLVLWCGLVLGAMAGAAAFAALALQALWGAVALAAILTPLALRVLPKPAG